jgi:hypothetical protein
VILNSTSFVACVGGIRYDDDRNRLRTKEREWKLNQNAVNSKMVGVAGRRAMMRTSVIIQAYEFYFHYVAVDYVVLRFSRR